MIAAKQQDYACQQWVNYEAAYEAFLAQYEQIDVLLMANDDFEAWLAEYDRLYYALHDAQIAYYKAVRA